MLLGSCGLIALLTALPSGVPWSIRLAGPSGAGGGCACAGNNTEGYNPGQYMTRVTFRSGHPSEERYGSWFQHYKGSLVAAMYLNRSLVVQDDVPS